MSASIRDMEVSMESPKFLRAAVATVGLLLIAIPSFAHHSFAVEFDGSKCLDFTGTLTRIDWQNPHAYFYVDVKDANGNVESWSFQTYSLVTLKRSGTERADFIENVGKVVFVRGCLAKNGVKNKAAAGTLKFSDGRLRQVGQLQD